MKLIALCSFYDESPTWLAAHAAATARLVDHIIYLDGAYVLYDADGASSGIEAHDAIARACHAAGVGFSIHVPATPWIGNEVAKRAFHFSLAEAMTTADDWYVVIDVDHILTSLDAAQVRADLATGDHDAYDATLMERYDSASMAGADLPSESRSQHTCFFRAIRGLTVRGAHYVYAYPDPDARWGWRALWGPHTQLDVSPPGTLQVEFEHWSKFRAAGRRQAAKDYYDRRDQARIERVSSNYIETLDGLAIELD